MVQFERITEMPLVREIMTVIAGNPQAFERIRDDFTLPSLEAPEHPSIWWVAVLDDSEVIGLFMLVPENVICWQIHVLMMPSAIMEKGRLRTIPRAFVSWVWANTHCRRLVAHVPEQNRWAIRFAQRGGMTEYGRNAMSFLKHGALQTLVDLGVSPVGVA